MIYLNMGKLLLISKLILVHFFINNISYAVEEIPPDKTANTRCALIQRHLDRLQRGTYDVPPPPETYSERFQRSMVTYIPRNNSLSPTLSSPFSSPLTSRGEGGLSHNPSHRHVSFDESFNTTHEISPREDFPNVLFKVREESQEVEKAEGEPVLPELIRGSGPAMVQPHANDPLAEEVCMGPPYAEIPTAPGGLPGTIDEVTPSSNSFPIHKLVTSAREDIRQERAIRDHEQRRGTESSCCCVVS